jgi:aspartyl/asparaginyl beta-hydroxylase (cupin superfamily)
MAELLRRGLLRLGPQRPCPSLFSVPGIAQQPFWSLEDLPSATQESIAALCASAPALHREYAMMASAAPAGDYSDETEHKLHKGEWRWHSAIHKGVFLPDFAVRCPATTGLLGAVPGLITGGVPFSYAFFSTLSAGASIAPHCGPTNTRLRVHIPCVVPPGDAGLVVAGERRAWEVGKPLIFDDSFLHHAYNSTSGDRLVFLFDIWAPTLHPEECDLVVEMFRSARKEGWLK